MTGDLEIYPATKITSALALVHALRTAGKPVRDVYRGQGGGYWISFDGWEVDEAAVREAVSKGWLVLTYPKKSREWWRLPEHMPAPRPRGWPRARVRGGRARSPGVAQRPTAARNADGLNRSRYFTERAAGKLANVWL